jgi:hypothetical protein
LPAPGYDQLSELRFEFMPLWDFLVFLHTPCGASTAAAVALWVSKKFNGDGKRTVTGGCSCSR